MMLLEHGATAVHKRRFRSFQISGCYRNIIKRVSRLHYLGITQLKVIFPLLLQGEYLCFLHSAAPASTTEQLGNWGHLTSRGHYSMILKN